MKCSMHLKLLQESLVENIFTKQINIYIYFEPGSIFLGLDAKPRVVARTGSDITLACEGVSSVSYIYLVEWMCRGCVCDQCQSANDEGIRLLRHHDKMTVRWDSALRRTLDTEMFGLEFSPVNVEDSGVYWCRVNNGHNISPVELIVQDSPEPPPHRPLITSISSRSVLLTWSHPLNDNHDPVNNFRIFVRENGDDHMSEIDTGHNRTEYLVTGLHPFTTYSFRVAAQNSIGHSLPSKESFPTQTHREKPTGAPRILNKMIKRKDSSVEIFWDPPSESSINGEFLGYVLTYNIEGSDKKTFMDIKEETLKMQNFTIFGLLNQTNYEVTIAAKNLEGLGPEASVMVRTAGKVPSSYLDNGRNGTVSKEVPLTTDTFSSSPPTVTNVNCSGSGDGLLCVGWTTPKTLYPDMMVTMFSSHGLNMLMVGMFMAVVASILMILAIAACHRSKQQGKYCQISTRIMRARGNGWTGDSSSDIPATLFPKHVQVGKIF